MGQPVVHVESLEDWAPIWRLVADGFRNGR